MVLRFHPKKLSESADFVALSRAELQKACTLIEHLREAELENARNLIAAYPLKNAHGQVLEPFHFHKDLIYYNLRPGDQKRLGVSAAKISVTQLMALANQPEPTTLREKFRRLGAVVLGRRVSTVASQILKTHHNVDMSEYDKCRTDYPEAHQAECLLKSEEKDQREGRSELGAIRALRQSLAAHRIQDIVVHRYVFNFLSHAVQSRLNGLNGLESSCGDALLLVAAVAGYEKQVRRNIIYKNPLFDKDERRFFMDPARVYDSIANILQPTAHTDPKIRLAREEAIQKNMRFVFGPDYPRKRLNEILVREGLRAEL